MKNQHVKIHPSIALEGAAIKAVSPLGKESAQRCLGPISAGFLSAFRFLHRDCRSVYLRRKDGSRLRVLIMRGTQREGKTIGILWLHGGGYVLGAPEMAYMAFPKHLLQHFNCVIVSPAYTLSYKKPFPAAPEDAYNTLRWMYRHRADLGIESEKIAVGGESAGGGLCVALCLYAREHGFKHIGLQMPLYPMLDDRKTPSSAHNHAPVWDTRANRTAWNIYLNNRAGTATVPAYAAPARAINMSGLPPAVSIIGTAEPFYAETRRYFHRLRQAGTEAVLAEFTGAYHAFDMLAPYASISKQATAFLLERFERYARKYLF